MTRKRKVSPLFGARLAGQPVHHDMKERPKMRKSMFTTLIIAMVAVMSMFVAPAAFTSTALASSAPLSASPFTTTINEDQAGQQQETQVAFKKINLKGKFLVKDEHIRIQLHTHCQWFKEFTNSSTLIGEYHGGGFNIHKLGYPDVNGYLCRDKYSPTGWVKRGGGHTGRDCGNIAAPPHHHFPFKIVKFSQLVEPNTKVKVYVTVNSKIKLNGFCGEVSGQGSASDWIWITYNVLIKAKGSGSLHTELSGEVFVEAKDKAETSAKLHCSREEKSETPPCTSCCGGCKPPPCKECCEGCKPPPCKECCEGCECHKTPEECEPKNGEEGPGHETPGPGEGCEAGRHWNGKECVKNEESHHEEKGGHEEHHEESQEGKGGGTGEGGYCRDRSTGENREAGPGEEADQFGYCTKV